jgi:enoyl-[acyl-carrier protein] reductase I
MISAQRDSRQRDLRRAAAHAGAAGISDFKSMLHHVAERAPLKRNIDAEEVGKSALYLCSDWGSAVTGEVWHVDAGYNIMGM